MGEEQKVEVPKSSLMDKEVSIKLKPMLLLKVLVVLLVLSGVFFLGRISVGDSSDLSGLAVNEVTAEDPAEPEPEVQLEEEVEAEPAPEPEVEEEEPEEEVEEEIITEYSNKIGLDIEDFELKWMETWGKITRMQVAITNNEAGSIEPGHLIMKVEGYGDFDKEVPLPPGMQLVKSGKTLRSMVEIPDGFSYSEASAGDLDEVSIQVLLFDVSGNVMASYTTQADLRG